MKNEIEALAAEAAAIDAEATPTPTPTGEAGMPAGPEDAPASQAVDPVESLAGFLTVAGIAAGYAGFPKTAAIWKQETCRGLAEKTVPVMVKYPWGVRLLDFLQTGAGVEELALLAYAAPLLLATRAAVVEDMKPTIPAAKEPEKLE